MISISRDVWNSLNPGLRVSWVRDTNNGLSRVQALPSGDLEMLLQQHPMVSGMGRAPSFGMGKLESMELPDAVAAVVRTILLLLSPQRILQSACKPLQVPGSAATD